MGSYNIYYFKDEFYDIFKDRYEPDFSSLSNRSIKDRYLVLSIGGFDPQFVRILYSYDKASDWPYRSHVELRVEGEYPYTHKDLLDYLVRMTNTEKLRQELKWLPLNFCENSICRYQIETIEWGDFQRILIRMMEIFDSLFAEYNELQIQKERLWSYSSGIPFDKEGAQAKHDLEYDILRIKELDFSHFEIPSYQRTYKWGRKNVNQLINDVMEFRNDSTYRLGTIVLNNGDIVDGQQRVVTLALLLSQMFRNPDIKLEINEHSEYQKLYASVIGFWERTKYKSAIAIDNINHNLDLIKSRESELGLDFFHTLVEKCEFVVVRLKSQSEAFQFFDAQNSRGKDLSPHDLLKAYHLREIPQFVEHDKENITYWQKIQTEDLENLFLTMFRIKRWSKGLTARFFTKDDSGAFKGLSIKDGATERPIFPLYGPAFYLYHHFASLEPERFPFQLDGEIINGSLFFDMIRHYNMVRETLYNPKYLENHPKTRHLIDLLKTYDKRNRIGDSYIRSLFDALMIYYVDKFGYEEIDRASEQFFLYAYGIRISNSKVSIATVDNAVLSGTMFRTVRDASSPLDIMNAELVSVKADDNCSVLLKNEFRRLNKLTNP